MVRCRFPWTHAVCPFHNLFVAFAAVMVTPPPVPVQVEVVQTPPPMPILKLPPGCMCAVDAWSNGGVPSIGCGSWGYGRKWCYMAGPNCTLVSEGKQGSKWRYCDGYLCQPYYQLPALQYFEFRVFSVFQIDSVPIRDWPDCCASCSLTKDCAAWRFAFLRDDSHTCNLFIGSTTDPALARAITQHLKESAVNFAIKASPFGSQVYGLPGYDDGVRTCLGLRWASELDQFREGGQCFSFLSTLYVFGMICIFLFAVCCCPWAWQWLRFAQVAHQRGEIVSCSATPKRLRHEWLWNARPKWPGGGNYLYQPVYEVDLTWERPGGVMCKMIFSDLDQADYLFDERLPRTEFLETCVTYRLPQVREPPCFFYAMGAGSSQQSKKSRPAAGVWAVETPPQALTIEVQGLVDAAHPDVVVPFQAEDGTGGAAALLRPVHAIPFCLCSCLAILPFFALALLKLNFPLLADGWIPSRYQGFDSVLSRSRYTPPVGLWDLPTLKFTARCGLALIFVFCLCCTIPWWYCYARRLLGEVSEVAWDVGNDHTGASETERLL